MKSILSIGFNPQFNNSSYSIEPYFYKEFKNTLLGNKVKLYLQGFIRTEADFSSIQGLIRAIESDLLFHELIYIQDGCIGKDS